MKILRYLDVQNILDKNDLVLQESGCVGSENERGNTYMKKIGIVTDSHSSISQEEAEKLGIFVLPMPFYIDGECFHESVTLSLGVSCHIGPGGMGIGCAVAPDYKRV